MTHILQQTYEQGFQHNCCALCGLTSDAAKFMFCSKCRVVVYCSKEHQITHWKRHKRFCKEHVWKKDNPYGVAASTSCRVSSCACKTWYSDLKGSPIVAQSATGDDQDETRCREDLFLSGSMEENGDGAKSTYAFTPNNGVDAYPSSGLVAVTPTNLALPQQIMVQPFPHVPLRTEDLENHAPAAVHASQSPVEACANFIPSYGHNITPENNGDSSLANLTLHSSRTSKLSLTSASTSTTSSSLSFSNSSKNVVHEGGTAVISGVDNNCQESSMIHSSATIPFQHRNNMQYISGEPIQQTRLWINQVWEQVIEDMNLYGVCVVDNLLGEARGSAVCREVQNMYSKGAFQDGQLVKSKDGQSKSIRGDKITWVDGSEPYCRNISILIKLLDNIVMGANNRNNNGKMGLLKIKERSKAMVACYPGSGTHYVKHVDNPNDDGRCVTAIYYLNKDWNTQENGGLLRIFPEGWSHQVADIEPMFDRVIFFWSDRRNPHEVQPAYKTRYAITLWYFDSNAKARAKKSAEDEDIATALKSC